MKRTYSVLLVLAGVIAVVGFAFAQVQKEIVLRDFKPTLSGHQNNAFVKTDTVGPEKKEMVVFWSKNPSEYELVAARGGRFWRSGSGLSGVKIGTQGERICFGEMYVAIDGESEFTGNLDYEGSTYTFIGKVRLLKHTFESNEKDPLVLKLVKDKGFIYVKGKGAVTTPKGDKMNFGTAK